MRVHHQPDNAPSGREFRSLVDLGTASVRALVVELSQGQTHIWGQGRASVEGSYAANGEIADREALAAACDAALCQAEEMTSRTLGHRIVPDGSIWSVPGWMCRSQRLNLDQRRSHPDRRISRREWQVFQARQERAVAHLPPSPVDVLSRLQVDGQLVTEAIDLQGEWLTLQTLVVSAEPQVLAMLFETAAALELELPVVISQGRASVAVLPADGLLLDVGRWGTAVSVRAAGQLSGSVWVPLGGQSFYRTLMNAFELSVAQLPVFCRHWADGQLTPEVASAAGAALVDTVMRWLDAIAGQLAILSSETPLPHRIYLAGGASCLPIVGGLAGRYDWLAQMVWSRHPEVHLWPSTLPEGVVNHTDHAWDVSDLVCLGLARLVETVII
ncbi:MAG: hypothetical protein ACOYZ7_11450 [Chloroflexota bacterium]